MDLPHRWWSTEQKTIRLATEHRRIHFDVVSSFARFNSTSCHLKRHIIAADPLSRGAALCLIDLQKMRCGVFLGGNSLFPDCFLSSTIQNRPLSSTKRRSSFTTVKAPLLIRTTLVLQTLSSNRAMEMSNQRYVYFEDKSIWIVFRILICGGGIIGTATAFYLSERDVASTIIEKRKIAGAASGDYSTLRDVTFGLRQSCWLPRFRLE